MGKPSAVAENTSFPFPCDISVNFSHSYSNHYITENMSGQSAVEQLGLRTAPFDARFPNQNQTKNCWQNFMDYQRCIKNKGEDYEPCNFFHKNYKSICPVGWVEKWNEQI